MLRNTMIKKILKSTVFKGISAVNKWCQKKDNLILLYSGNKGITYNLAPLLQYLIDNRYNIKNKIICAVESEEYFGTEEKNVKYATHIQAVKWFLRAGHVFYTAGQLPIIPSNNQIVFHLQHGIANYKTIGALTKINNGNENYFTYMLATSPLYVPILAKAYMCSKEKMVVASEPMVDRMLKPRRIYDFSEYDKVLLWAPTFRQSDYLGYNDSRQEELVPLFEESDYSEINEQMKNINCLLIVKLHPSQKTSEYKKRIYSHFKVLSHEEFEREGYYLYDLMGQINGLIGDYSSVSLQFLLRDKPEAFVIPDYEEYKEKRGFVFKNAKEYMPGKRIYDKEGFWCWIDEFARNIDRYSNERKRIRDLVYTYQKGESCKRILEVSGIKK